MNARKRRLPPLLLAALLGLSLPGCADMLDTEYRSSTPHVLREEISPQEYQPDTEVNIPAGGSLEDLTRAVENLIRARSVYGVIRASSYQGDMEADAETACLSVAYNTPYGTYAVHNVSYTVNRYVSFSELRVHLSYNDDVVDFSTIPRVYTLDSGKIVLENTLRAYGTRLVIATANPELDLDFLTAAVEELYYTGADWMPVLPRVTGSVYPPQPGEDRILDLRLSYDHSNYRMDSMTARTRTEVDRLVAELRGLEPEEALRRLSETLRDHCRLVYESGTEEGYDRRKDQYTAYGALALGRASGEGIAMAVKKVAGDLEIPCLVVRGRLNNAAHAWNLVEVEGQWYHLDISRMTELGFDPCFLAEDAQFLESYYWDQEKYPASGHREAPEESEPPPEAPTAPADGPEAPTEPTEPIEPTEPGTAPGEGDPPSPGAGETDDKPSSPEEAPPADATAEP